MRDLVSMRLDGVGKVSQDDLPKFGTNPRQARIPRQPKRGYDAKLMGYAKYDLSKGRFRAFELVVHGTHHGGGMIAKGKVPMGILLTLAGDGPVDRVPRVI